MEVGMMGQGWYWSSIFLWKRECLSLLTNRLFCTYKNQISS